MHEYTKYCIRDGEGATSQWLFSNGITTVDSAQHEQDKEALNAKKNILKQWKLCWRVIDLLDLVVVGNLEPIQLRSMEQQSADRVVLQRMTLIIGRGGRIPRSKIDIRTPSLIGQTSMLPASCAKEESANTK